MGAFETAVAENRSALLSLSEPELAKVLPVLRSVRDETARVMNNWIKKSDPVSAYTLQRHRALLAQLDTVIRDAKRELSGAMVADLTKGAHVATGTALKNLAAMVRAGEQQFAGSVGGLRLPIAKLMTSVEKTLMTQHETSAARYAGRVGDLIRSDLAKGVVRGESVSQLARRLMRRGGDPDGGAIADAQFFRGQWDAERLVRTETVNAYTQSQNEALAKTDEDDPGWMKRWDAANDKRVCEDCDQLDGIVVAHDEEFPYDGGDGPPLHPNCRCTITPWRSEWSGSGRKAA
jgi:SPP1 gp7 family putative phage head morphogenesis protein